MPAMGLGLEAFFRTLFCKTMSFKETLPLSDPERANVVSILDDLKFHS